MSFLIFLFVFGGWIALAFMIHAFRVHEQREMDKGLWMVMKMLNDRKSGGVK